VPPKPFNNYPQYEGVANYVQNFEDPRTTPQPGPSAGVETRAQIKERKRKIQWQKEMQRIEDLMKTCKYRLDIFIYYFFFFDLFFPFYLIIFTRSFLIIIAAIFYEII